MAENDASQYVLRYNEISDTLEFKSGNMWTPISSGGGAFVPLVSPTEVIMDTNSTGALGPSAFAFTIRSNMSSKITLFGNGDVDFSGPHVFADNYLGVGNVNEDPSAILEVVSTTQGFLPPVMTTTQKDAITTPAEGLVVYDVTLHKLSVWTGAAWETVTSA